MFGSDRVVVFSVDGVSSATHFLYKNEVFPLQSEFLKQLPKLCEVYLNPSNADIVNIDEAIPDMLSVVDVKDSISLYTRFPEDCFKTTEENLLSVGKLPSFYAYSSPIRRLDRGLYFEVYHAKDAGVYKLTFFSIEDDLGSIGTSRISDDNDRELSNALKEIALQFSTNMPISIYSNDPLKFELSSIFAGYHVEVSKKSFVHTGKTKDFVAIPSNEVTRILAQKVAIIGLSLFCLSVVSVITYQYFVYRGYVSEIEEGTLEIQRLQNEKSRLELELKAHASSIAAYYATDTQPDWPHFFLSLREGMPEGSSFSKLEVSKTGSFMKPSWNYVARLDLPSIAVSFIEYKDVIKNNLYFKNAALVEHLSNNEKYPFIMLTGNMPIYRDGIEVKSKLSGGSTSSAISNTSSTTTQQSGASVLDSKRAKQLGMGED